MTHTRNLETIIVYDESSNMHAIYNNLLNRNLIIHEEWFLILLEKFMLLALVLFVRGRYSKHLTTQKFINITSRVIVSLGRVFMLRRGSGHSVVECVESCPNELSTPTDIRVVCVCVRPKLKQVGVTPSIALHQHQHSHA